MLHIRYREKKCFDHVVGVVVELFTEGQKKDEPPFVGLQGLTVNTIQVYFNGVAVHCIGVLRSAE